MDSDSAMQSAMEDILDGHTHRAAYSRLQKNGVSPGVAIATVVEAGQRVPLMRHRLQAAAEDYNPSGCCDYCGRRLDSAEFRGQKMRWRKRGAMSWNEGAVDALAYLCGSCRVRFHPTAVEAALQGLLWSAPLVAVAGLVDYVALYVVTITTTETETQTGFHLWCPRCEWKAVGGGVNLWAVAGSLGTLLYRRCNAFSRTVGRPLILGGASGSERIGPHSDRGSGGLALSSLRAPTRMMDPRPPTPPRVQEPRASLTLCPSSTIEKGLASRFSLVSSTPRRARISKV